MTSTRNIILLVVLICSLLANFANGQYFSAHEGSVLNRNGKRSYLIDLIKTPDADSKAPSNFVSDGYYLADKLSMRNKFKKFGRRANSAYEELRNKIITELMRDSNENDFNSK